MIKQSDNKDSHDRSCVMMLIEDEKLINKLAKFNKANIPDRDIDEEAGGREIDEYHITVLYGLYTKRLSDVLDYIEDDLQEPIKVKLGKVSRFENDGYDVIKIDILAYDKLKKMWKKLKTKLDNDNKYNQYEPHCTLAYVVKGAVPDIDGDETFNGMTITLSTMKFSPADGLKAIKVPLENDLSEVKEQIEKIME